MPRDFPLSAVLGLAQTPDEDWMRLRALQFSSLAKMSLSRLLAHAIAAVLVFKVYSEVVHTGWLFIWLATLAGTVVISARLDRTLSNSDHRLLTRREVLFQTGASAANAIAWTIPVLFFAPYGTDMDQMVLWTAVAMLMTGSAVSLAAVPLSALLFSYIVGGAVVLSFAMRGAWDIVAIVVVFLMIVSVATIEAARTYLAVKMAEAGNVEKSEVVSLLLREFEDNEADWLWQTDASRRLCSISARFAFALGLDPADISGQPFIQLVAGSAWDSGNFHPSLHKLADKLQRRESFANLLVRVSIKGQSYWWELSGTPRINEQGNFDGFRGVGSDVTEKRENAEKIAYLARYDTLTGLPNRLLLTETLGEAMRYAEQWRTRCAFLMIDLDRFKAVNDTLGHLVGDQLLARVSERLRSVMTENELCGRLGGDEFGIVIRDGTDMGHVQHVSRQVIEMLSMPYEIDHHTLYVGASVGSAIGPRDGATVEELMRNADLALYRSKDQGGGKHFTYEPSLHTNAEERRKLEFSLRHALERNEFTLQYQPVVDAKHEGVVSFEALLRWNSKEHGAVSPAKFIPLAEDTRLIVPIGEWVLREACREAVKWPRNIRIAVNVSGEQLLEPNFSSTVVSALSTSGLAPSRLEIEVTESIFLRDGTTAQAALEQVMALGCGIALDDFGTGYSSLGYLRKIRFSTIKVDRSFIQGAAKNSAESLAIIRAVVAMADSLEMSTIAEGAETEAEVDMIRQLGCKKIQGYFFGRPMDATDALALFTPRSSRTRIAAA